MKALVCLLVLGCLQGSQSYPTGPTIAACRNMLPQHGASPQTSSAPYNITTSSVTYRSGQDITVTVQATEPMETPFKGFFVQARTEGSTDAIGEFDTGNDTDLGVISCQDGRNNAISHSNSNNKTIKTFIWRGSGQSDIFFQGTFVNRRPTFWINVRSNTVRATGRTSNSVQLNASVIAVFLSIVLKLSME